MKILINKLIKDIKEKLKKERIKLTDARALMLYVLYDLINKLTKDTKEIEVMSSNIYLFLDFS